MRTSVAVALLGFTLNAWAAPETYRIDDAHSFANWNVRHLVGRTTGTFTGVKGTLTLDPANPNSGAADVTIDVYSLESGHRQRDAHLLTGDFFDANNYPTMRFVASGCRATGKDEGVMSGQLTLRGATRQVEIPYKILGFGADPWGGMRAGFEGRFTLKRSDYGITKHVDSGVVGNEVEVTLLVEALKLGPDGQPVSVKAKPAAPAAVQPAATQPAQPAKPAQPDLMEMFRGLMK
jgi:polyisoprenoid-binding protein YceI